MFSMTPDWNFARRILESDPDSFPAGLFELPAFDALIRHQILSGNPSPDGDILLSGVLENIPDRNGAHLLMEKWENRYNDIIEYSKEALRYLPGKTRLSGKIFFVAGYDIGIVAPPDVAINISHQHFINHPDDVGYYLTHEVHHLGFLSFRTMPPIRKSLRTVQGLLDLIFFMTQMEGMAVHSAYNRRKAEGHLEDNDDYRFYYDPVRCLNIMMRFWNICDSITEKESLTDGEISATLAAMSSGERLWYRYGAIISAQLEKELGLEALVASIEEPGIFMKYAQTHV
ncbi:MAG: hypothetical protein K8R76_01140 [Candidatus Aegiribacteria sp.]|nr:hypothetical protein [Candidatus Aegiribacteria sp.]